MKIGIPKGLWYYEYFPFWKAFFQNLGHKVVVSKSTDPLILEKGINFSIGDVCLPVKVYLGHVISLVNKENIDAIFSPRYVSTEKKKYTCPKLLGISDIISTGIKTQKQILTCNVDTSKNNFTYFKELIKLGQQIGNNPISTINSYREALSMQHEYETQLLEGYTPAQILKETNTSFNDYELTISVLGHPYNVNDEYINFKIQHLLQKNNVKILTSEMVSKATKQQYLNKITEKNPFWCSGEKLLGTAIKHSYKKDVDGVIMLTSFGCGPDSLIFELTERVLRNKKVPVLTLTIDEHQGKAGFITRIEAFIDMLKRRKKSVENYVSTHG
ncbi:acyl-CoA dehydratase activase-related protein [Natranaerobius trueperi]|uniref:DUF2229 domain-containing protein n=1 Tax=Natranaerobius trueperi TaxID=759412 RepID=A0A226BZL1_9FIRM|nr:acyl-CoA dehydratase activase-related protein [Natranaerobius trueperi]OWZ84361.1 hypothetical protein CDO51_03615 [Natranaerobius trueperi]